MTVSPCVVHYAPGPSTGIAASALWVVIDDVPGGQLSLSVLDAVVGGASGDVVLDLLLALGLRGAPSFAMVERGPHGWRVAGRGAGLVSVEVDGEVVVLHGRRGLLDEDIEVADVLTLSLGATEAATPIPMAGGLVPVESIRVACSTTAAASTEGHGAAKSASPASLSPWARLSEAPADDSVESGSAPGGATSVDIAPSLESSSQYDSLFASQEDPAAEVVEAASPVTDVEPDLGDSFPTSESSAQVAGTAAVEEPPLEPAAAPARVAGAFIDTMPDFLGGPAPRLVAPSPSPSTDSRDAHISRPLAAPVPPDGEVVALRDSRTVRRGALSQGAPASAPLVYAARCPRNHLSPAHAAHCRVCGEVVAAQEPFEVPRPPLGRLVLPTGDVIVLDRDVCLGREPRLPDDCGSTAPHLVRLTDPRQEVSGQHATIRLNYWHVTLEDLGSTNGTEIIAPDGRRQRLVAHSPVVIESGTTIVLAEIIEVSFEASS